MVATLRPLGRRTQGLGPRLRAHLTLVRTCVRVDQGSPQTWLTPSIQRGDLAGIRAAAAEMPAVNLADALAILPVIAAKDPDSYERAACRWLARLALERDVGLDEIGVAVGALDRLPERPADTQILRRLLG